jgi:hypothetical protein
MSSSTKIDLYRDFAAVVYLFEAQNPILPPYTLYTRLKYTYSHREWRRGGGGSLTREKVRGATLKVQKAGSKIPT